MVTTLGPTQVKSSARMDGSRRPRSDATMALARLKSASGSFDAGGGTDGGRGCTADLSSANGFEKLSKNDISKEDEAFGLGSSGVSGVGGDAEMVDNRLGVLTLPGIDGSNAVELVASMNERSS